MSKTKKIAILAIIAMVLTMMPAAMFAADTDSDRLAGSGRVETALAVAEAGWESSDAVVLAAADQANLVDALAAAPLAGQKDAPILITFKDSLNADVKARIADLGAETVYAVGAISDDVVKEVEAIDGVAVEVLKGASRWETAAAINAELEDVAGTFVVGYAAVADAMSVASFAAANNYAIVLADAEGNVDEADLLGDEIYIVGGETLVADIDGATRFAGDDRFETNAEVAAGLEFEYGKVYVANGLSLVDALSVAPLAAQANAFVLLSSASDVEELEGATGSTQYIAVGGTGVVPNKILDKLTGRDGGEFGVKSVEAANLKQIKVELSNTDYDEEELTDVDNYEFDGDSQGDSHGRDVNIDFIDATVEGTTLTLTLETAVENQSEGTLVVDSVITGEELEFTDIKFFDSDIPTIEDVSVIGKNVVKFVFSEPIELKDAKGEFDFSLDGKSYSVKKVDSVKQGLEANVYVYSTFTEGTLEVEVGNGLEDYAGFNIIAETFEVDVVEDKDAPEVTGVKKISKDEVTLVFNEDIQLESKDEDDYYHTNSSNEVDEDSMVDNASDPDDNSIDGNELTLKFSEHPLPDGVAYVYISTGSVSDLWDNENNSIRYKVELAVDDTKPEVKKVEYKDDDGQIIVTYTEKMDDDTATDRDNYTLVDEDGDDVTISKLEFDDGSTQKKVALTLRNASELDDGTYELTIEKVEDVAGNKIEKATFDVEIGDTDAPAMPDPIYVDTTGSKNYELFVEFGKQMAVSGSNSVADLYKYDIKPDGGSWINLGKTQADDDYDVDIDVTDGDKVVRITIEKSAISGDITDAKFRIARVADSLGNISEVSELMVERAIKNVDDRGILITEVKAKDRKTLEVTFDGNLDEFEVDDFTVYDSDNDITYYVDDVIPNASNAKKATFKMDKKIPADATDLQLHTEDILDKIGTESSYGAKLEAAQTFGSDPAESFADEIDPEVLFEEDVDTSVKYGSEGNKDAYAVYAASSDGTTSTVTIILTEMIDTPALQVISVDGFDVNEGTISVGSLTKNNQTMAELTFDVNGVIYQGADIDLRVIIDQEGNETTGIELEVEYAVEEIRTIGSVGSVADVTVDNGTSEAEAKAALAPTVVITDSFGDTYTRPLTWTIASYDGSVSAGYTATGTFTLPSGVGQSDPETTLEVTATVTVSAP